ncbi:hypothetical protein KFE25_010824 [Diacronema lutheri]|uniref:Malate synthase n=1 Tax=Diacronema lutheri TaxID=2081491 RepID=A0A8J5XAZ4_DIALT|nr:hypothetical protein KFE25_010824 [Diacronema lutheri]
MLRHAVHRPTGSLASGALPWTAGRGGIARAAARAPRASPPPLQPGARALAAGAPAGRAYVAVAGIEVDRALKRLVDEVIMPGTGVEPEPFWRGFAAIALELAPRNRALLDERDSLQAQIDAYHVARRGQPHDAAEYRAFLTQIGYLIAPPSTAGPATVRTTGVDPEIAETAGPQLVCPVDNARFIVNAANARWGSLLDALYGTDVVPGPRGGPYSPERGAAVWDEAHRYLDRIFPLDAGVKWGSVHGLTVSDGPDGDLRASLSIGCTAPIGLLDPSQIVGYRGEPASPSSILLRNHGLHVELVIDRASSVGKAHKAGLADVQVEAALTAICDAEDSACSVDADDKMRTYANWHGLMTGALQVPMEKGGQQLVRSMNEDRTWTSLEADKQGSKLTLPGRALLLCRNVGLHMYTDIARTADGDELPEHFVDAAVTILAACHDLRGPNRARNSRTGSVYIVKPKMHAPAEVALVDTLFGHLEALLALPPNCVKVGVMDEERRASANLPEMMRAAHHRLCFVNTGFLDRTGDEIHTSMEAGPVLAKGALKAQAAWYAAYEEANVASALQAGLLGRGQIGKGMWAAPDNMAQMMRDKLAHLKAGASCAWVPSPTAATLHALHYHTLSVHAVQTSMLVSSANHCTHAVLDRLLELPILAEQPSAECVRSELENNAQSILGYVSRWVGQGVGCSKVNDISGTALMEDRATLRISSQHIANWLHHGLTSQEQVLETMRRMAQLVDEQNGSDPLYQRMAPGFDGPEWKAAVELVLAGRAAPNGYTEFTLTKWRKVRKALSAQ